jgi:hypothetical protein
MIFVFNAIGMNMLLAAGLLAGLFSALLVKTGCSATTIKAIGMAGAGVLMVAFDLHYRMKVGESSLLHPRRGGHIMFVPIWIIGGFFMVGSIGEAVSGNPEISARESSQSTQSSYSQGSPSRGSSAPANKITYLSEPQPEAHSPKVLKVGMISGVGVHRIATVNGQPFAEGESHKLNIGASKLTVQCLEIRDQSVVVKTSGDPHSREIKIGQPLTLNQ